MMPFIFLNLLRLSYTESRWKQKERYLKDDDDDGHGKEKGSKQRKILRQPYLQSAMFLGTGLDQGRDLQENGAERDNNGAVKKVDV